MITTSLFFDRTKAKQKGTASLCISLSAKGKRSTLSLGIVLKEKQWDGKRIMNHPNKNKLNSLAYERLTIAEEFIQRMEISGALAGKSLKETALMLKEHLDPEYAEAKQKERDTEKQFLHYYEKFTETKTNPGTHSVYACTLRMLKRYADMQEPELHTLHFEEFNRTWLQRIEDYCSKTEKQSTINIHLRNIRAAFNAAIDDGLCTNYPFRKYKLHNSESRDKSLTLEELKELFATPCNNDGERFAIDMFKLEFCLIGINNGDLYNAPKPKKGRLIYERAKTRKRYSIKIEPEAADIIHRYEGESSLLNLKERFRNYETLFHRASASLKKTGLICVSGKKSKGKALQPDICFGSARTSWATIAQQVLDIPREVIAAALGHHTVDVTDTYLRTAWQDKIDKANRQVLDLVFGTAEKDKRPIKEIPANK